MNSDRQISMDRMKLIFGYTLLLMLGALAFAIAIGKVHSESSFGLMPILTTLSTLAGAFASWAFREKHSTDAVSESDTPAVSKQESDTN